MPAVAIATVILVGLLVVALAAYLTWVVFILRRVTDTLGQVAVGVRTIADRTEPLTERIEGINAELLPVAHAVEALADRVSGDRRAAASS